MTDSEQSSIDTGFDLLAKNTELSLGEYTSITQSQADIELVLTQQLGTFSTQLFGAFTRKTIVSPLPGCIVDMLVLYRDIDVRYSFPSRTFAKLRDTLLSRYPAAYVLEQRNAVMLPMKNFLFKIQPAYTLQHHNYMLPAEKFNDWVSYDVNAFNEIFVKENVRHKGKLIDIVRMMKTWNRVSGNLFNGYYLELLVTSVLSSYEIKGYSDALRHVFSAAIAEVVFQKHDPANIEFEIEGLNNIDSLITAMILLNKSYHLANQAILFERENNIEKALEVWNKVFLSAFPKPVDMAVAKIRRSGIKGADALRMMIEHKQTK